ncbi:DUF4116 domain-containing protein [Endozoicomonas sp. SCSIO W0465]|uniref:DUF4116 domain-containing protein n=1 Tax=Endozoicomonas sp. SCSIO W0465 TaxID=2918516 RepID=UPI002075313C|nr:DUF4116 domain-containing protein [Endozoicomonas sp. SCSIO W0465]USE37207.1 DUF4116 domain-containing protein [Endozoicomonas sp. SCSIO W0465]
MLGAAADPKLEQSYREEITALDQQLALLQAKVEQTLADVTRPFLSEGELPASGSDFQQWRASCQLLKDLLQRLESVNSVQRIESVHELILWLHKCFIARLWPVATASGQGTVSRLFTTKFSGAHYDCFHIIDFSTSQEAPLFDSTCYDALRQFSADSATVLNMPECTRLSIQLQAHACTIDLLEQADSGKQRTFRLCYSEPLTGPSKELRRAKLQRVCFLTQTLSQYQKNNGFDAPEVHFNEQTGQVLFEFTHLPARKDLQRMFVDILSVLKKLANVDFFLESLNLDESQTQWNMAAIRERLNNPAFSATNQFALEHIYWCFAYKERESLISRCTHDRTIRHLVEAALIFSHPSTCTSEIEALLEDQPETDRNTLLWHWLLSDPGKAKPLVEQSVNWLADETMALRLVSQNGHILEHLAPEIRNRRAVVFAAIKSHPEVIAKAPESFRNDLEMMNYALANAVDPEGLIALIGAELRSNPVLFRQLLTTAVENKASALSSDAITAYLEQNPEFYKELVLLAIERAKDVFYPIYRNACRINLLKNDPLYRKLALAMVSQESCEDNLKYLSDWKHDQEVVYTAVGYEPLALKFAGPEFQADKALVKEAVGKMGRVLEFASEELRDDKEIVLAAVRNNGSALKYASERLRADPIIVSAALKNTAYALKFAAEPFKQAPYYLRLAVHHHDSKQTIRAYLDEVQRGNKELLTIAVSIDPNSFEYASHGLRDDEALAQLAVQGNGILLEFASCTLRGHKPTVRLAVQHNGLALEYASWDLRDNEDLVRLAVQNYGMALEFASERLRNNPEVVKLALQQNPSALQFASDACRNDPELVGMALELDGNVLRYVGRSLQNEPWVITAAVNSIGAVAVRHIQQSIARESLAVEFVASPSETADTEDCGSVSSTDTATEDNPSVDTPDDIVQTCTQNDICYEDLFSESFLAEIKILCDKSTVKDIPKAEGGTKPVYLPESCPQIVLKHINKINAQARLDQKQKVREVLSQLECSHLVVPKAIACNDFLVEERLPINIDIYHNLRCYLSEPELFDEPVREMVRLSSKFFMQNILTGIPFSLKFRYLDGVRYYPKYENLPLYSVKENGLKQGRIGLIDLEAFFHEESSGQTLPYLARIFPLHEDIIRDEADRLGLPYDEDELSMAFSQGNKCLKAGYSDHADWLKSKGITSEYMNWSFDISQKSSDGLNNIIQQELILMNQGKSVVYTRNVIENPRGGFLTGEAISSAKMLTDKIAPMIIANLKQVMSEYIYQNTSGKIFTDITEDQMIFLRSPIAKISRYYQGIEDVLDSSPCFHLNNIKSGELSSIAEQLTHSALSHLVTCKEILYYSQKVYDGIEKYYSPYSKRCWLGY